jgi:hypothetical protein
MKGKYHIIIQNNRIKFEFDVKRNITIIRGDSATGKTTLMNMVETYERMGDESGISLSCSQKCRTLNNSNWENVIDQSRESIIFIDEETKIINTEGFASKIKCSDNYYVIITRENLPLLPYSVEEVYGIHTSGKYADVRQTYNSFYRLYSFGENRRDELTEKLIVEDSNSGYEFFSSIIDESIICLSAGGKSKIKSLVRNNKGSKILVVADGAAFGSEMGELYLYMHNNPEINIYLPESFEWIILSSGLIDGNRIAEIVEHPEDFIESSEYFSWENYFTKLLIQETKDTYLHYNKRHLNEAYLNNKEKTALIKVINIIKDQIGI